MNVPIDAKRLRATLPDVVERVRKGARFTVIYRSGPCSEERTSRGSSLIRETSIRYCPYACFAAFAS